MLEKSSAALKKYVDFWKDFPSIFREKLIQNRKKDRKNCLAHESRQRIQVGSALFEKKIDFGSNFGVPLCPRGVREPPRTPVCVHPFSPAQENRPGMSPGRPQDRPGRPPGTSRAAFFVDFGCIFRVHFISRSFGDALNF